VLSGSRWGEFLPHKHHGLHHGITSYKHSTKYFRSVSIMVSSSFLQKLAFVGIAILLISASLSQALPRSLSGMDMHLSTFHRRLNQGERNDTLLKGSDFQPYHLSSRKLKGTEGSYPLRPIPPSLILFLPLLVYQCFSLTKSPPSPPPSFTPTPTPTHIDSQFQGYFISSGGFISCALVSGVGSAMCWGSPVPEVSWPSPTLLDTGISFNSISCGGNFCCGIQNGMEKVWCFGVGSNGQLGTGNTSSSTTPVPAQDGETYSFLSCGEFHCCGILAETGKMKCWGDNGSNQLAQGFVTRSTTPVLIEDGQNKMYSQVASGHFSTCALAGFGGEAWCWGANWHGKKEREEKNTIQSRYIYSQIYSHYLSPSFLILLLQGNWVMVQKMTVLNQSWSKVATLSE